MGGGGGGGVAGSCVDIELFIGWFDVSFNVAVFRHYEIWCLYRV